MGQYNDILSLISQYHKFKLLLILITLTVLLNTLLYTHIYTVFYVISDNQIVNHLITYESTLEKNLCVQILFSGTLLNPTTRVPTDSSNWISNLNLSEGGEWQPSHCTARHLVAIIIPYRNREEHLEVFLYNIHPFLQCQNIHYKIFIIEQDDKKDFNRGKLFNIGFVEALKVKPFPCFIFHDVDLIPQNLNNVYTCTEFPRHMSSSIDKFRYNVPYDRNFGGVVAISTQQYRAVNGYSNNYYGWGGEDDDFFFRVRDYGLQFYRFSQEVSRYKSLFHPNFKPAEDRFTILEKVSDLYQVEGLNSLDYHVKAKIETPTHVRMIVEL